MGCLAIITTASSNIELSLGQYISTDTTVKGVKQFAQQAVWDWLDAHDSILEHRIE